MTDAVPHPVDRHAFPLLDGARGIAALAVVGFHAVAAMQIPALFEFAFLGVDFFFLLSGFVVGHAYGDRLRAGGYLGRFAVLRFVRLYPMIVLGTLVGLVFLRPEHHPAEALAAGLVMLPHLWAAPGGFLYPLDPALWSLLFEVLANLAFALLAPKASVRTLAIVCLVNLPLIVLGRSLHVGWETGTFLLGFPRTAFSFALGLLLQRLHAQGRLPRWGRATPFALIALVAALALPLPMAHDRFPVLLLYVTVLFPVILTVLADARPGPRGAALCRWAGEASYPLYALHVPIVMSAGAKLLAAHDTLGERVGAVFVLMAAVALMATLAARFVDAPVRTWLGARLLRRRTTVAAIA